MGALNEREAFRCRLQTLLAQHLHFVQPLHEDTSLQSEVAPDSLERLTLLVEVENAFGLCIDEAQAQTLHTVGDLLDHLLAHASHRPASLGDPR